jgi:hypothetical protein
MFDSALVKHLKSENEYLRNQVKELMDQIIVLSGKVTDQMKVKENAMPFEPTTFLDFATGNIEKMPAETEEQKVQREAALREYDELLHAQ